jgi:hypothetical protein
VQHPQHLIGHQLWRPTTERQRIQPHRPQSIGRIEQHHVAHPLRWKAQEYVGDQVAFGFNDDHGPPGGYVLRDEVEQQRGLTRAGRPERVQVSQ